MRILTKKIHRAYPELDKFDDEACKRYIRRAKQFGNAWKIWTIFALVIPSTVVIWFLSMILLNWTMTTYAVQLPSWLDLLIFLPAITGIIWFPALATLLTRDRWLHRCLRKQLTGVQCPTCGYSLIGLALLQDLDHPSVHCPECGHTTTLKDMGLTQADIDPSLIPNS